MINILNQVIIVGRLTKEPELTVKKEKRTIIELAIPRSFKNKDGEYETDFVSVVAEGNIANSTVEYCKKGDIIGIKGNVRTEVVDNDRKMFIVAERITFLSSRKEDNNKSD